MNVTTAWVSEGCLLYPKFLCYSGNRAIIAIMQILIHNPPYLIPSPLPQNEQHFKLGPTYTMLSSTSSFIDEPDDASTSCYSTLMLSMKSYQMYFFWQRLLYSKLQCCPRDSKLIERNLWEITHPNLHPCMVAPFSV